MAAIGTFKDGQIPPFTSIRILYLQEYIQPVGDLVLPCNTFRMVVRYLSLCEVQTIYEVFACCFNHLPCKCILQSIPDNDEDPLSELIDELIVLLDPENKAGSDAGNWKDLADKMGCGLARIRWLKAQESPTKILVRKWIHEKKKSLADLKSLLLEINRPDAAYEVDKRLRASGQSVTVL